MVKKDEPAGKAREQATRAVVSHLRMLGELKARNTAKASPRGDVAHETQSELHMRAVLGDKYQENDLDANVAQMLSEDSWYRDLEPEKQQRLIQNCVAFIKEERQHGEERMYFYHACPRHVAFAYDVYSAIQKVLQANQDQYALRLYNEKFKKFNSLHEFITFFSGDEKYKKAIDHNPAYIEVGISATWSLFGCHKSIGEHPMSYFLKNSYTSEISLPKLLAEMLPANVPESSINSLLAVYEKNYAHDHGALYQFSLPTEDADNYCYMAQVFGATAAYNDSYTPSKVKRALRQDLSDKKNTEKYEAARNYLFDIQLRAVVPPHAALRAKAITGENLSIGQGNTSTKTIEQGEIIDPIVSDILLNQTEGTLHEKTPAHFLLQSHLASNELPMDKSISIGQLRAAIDSNNDDQLVEYLNTEPETGKITLVLSINSGKHDLSKIIVDKLPALRQEILPATPGSYINKFEHDEKGYLPDVIFMQENPDFALLEHCYGENWANNLPEGFIHSAGSLSVTLQALPEKEVASYMLKHFPHVKTQGRLGSGDHFGSWALCMNKDELLALAKLYDGSNPPIFDLREMILNIAIVKHYDDLAEFCLDSIKDFDAIRAAIWEASTEENKHVLARIAQKGGKSLACVLFHLYDPKRARSFLQETFGNQWKSRIMSDETLSAINEDASTCNEIQFLFCLLSAEECTLTVPKIKNALIKISKQINYQYVFLDVPSENVVAIMGSAADHFRSLVTNTDDFSELLNKLTSQQAKAVYEAKSELFPDLRDVASFEEIRTQKDEEASSAPRP